MSGSLLDGNFTSGRLPGPIDSLADPVYRWARREISRGVQRTIHMAGEVAYDAAMRELRALQDDIGSQLRYIAGLPEGLRQHAAYATFAAGFSHYLPKKFLRQYVWGHGASMTLTLPEMIDCNPFINLPRSKRFVELAAQAAKVPGTPMPLKMGILSSALTNGTLGQFTALVEGTLLVSPDYSWRASGTMSFYDEWDFDPKDFKTGGRTLMGEVKTRMAHYSLLGTGFKIFSETTAFTQTQDDASVVWAGGTPTSVPDRIAEADVALSNLDQ